MASLYVVVTFAVMAAIAAADSDRKFLAVTTVETRVGPFILFENLINVREFNCSSQDLILQKLTYIDNNLPSEISEIFVM